MGNRKSREFMLSQEEKALWHRIRNEPRPASRDVYATGIGMLRMQLIVCPSFMDGKVWEVRQRESQWSLFRPKVCGYHPDEVQLVDYESLAFPSEQLASYFRRITEITLPLAIDSVNGCDGTTCQLTICGVPPTSCRFRWWSDSPQQWQPLIEIADEMISAFSTIQ